MGVVFRARKAFHAYAVPRQVVNGVVAGFLDRDCMIAFRDRLAIEGDPNPFPLAFESDTMIRVSLVAGSAIASHDVPPSRPLLSASLIQQIIRVKAHRCDSVRASLIAHLGKGPAEGAEQR